MFCLFYYLSLLPFQPKTPPITLGIMLGGLLFFISGGLREKLKALNDNSALRLPLFFFLLLSIGCLYTPNVGEGAKDLGMMVPLAAWPVIFAGMPPLAKSDQRSLLRFFVLATAASMLWCFGDSLYRYLAYPYPEVFYFEELVNYSRIPPHYLGMFVNFAYGLVFLDLLRKRNLWSSRGISLLLMSFFFLSLLFISVRNQYLVFLAVNGLALAATFKRRGAGKAVSITVGAMLLFLLLAWLIPGTRARMQDTYNELRAVEGMVENKQTNPRVYLWQGAAEVIGKNWLIGTGPGAENQALTKTLLDDEALFWDGTKNYYLYQKRYNYHNTYLQVFAALGLPGILTLLAFFIMPFWWARRLPFRLEASIFLVVSGLSFVTESMLQRQAGILFFSFFYAFFFVLPGGLKQKKERND